MLQNVLTWLAVGLACGVFFTMMLELFMVWNATDKLRRRVGTLEQELQKALDQLKTLEGLESRIMSSQPPPTDKKRRTMWD